MSFLTGYSSRKKLTVYEQATVNRVGKYLHGANVISFPYYELIGTDAVEASSTDTIINATTHSAKVGDVIKFTSGTEDKNISFVESVTTNTITLGQTLDSTPAAADTFSIYRPSISTVTAGGADVNVHDGNGVIITSGTTGVNDVQLASFRGLDTRSAIFLYDGTGLDTWRGTSTTGAEVNIKAYGGTTTTLGQKSMTSSIPVAIASNQTAVPCNITQVGSGIFTLDQKTMTNSLPVVIASNQTVIPINDNSGSITVDGTITASNTAGDVAHDGVDSGNPVKKGLQARQTNPTAVADGDRVNAIGDDLGRQVVVLNQVRDLVTDNNITLTSTTTETTLLSAVASTFLDLTQLVITNSSSTATTITIRDATAGTARMIIDIAANGGAVISFAVPRPQTTVNNDWTAQSSASVASIHIYAQAVKNI